MKLLIDMNLSPNWVEVLATVSLISMDEDKAHQALAVAVLSGAFAS